MMCGPREGFDMRAAKFLAWVGSICTLLVCVSASAQVRDDASPALPELRIGGPVFVPPAVTPSQSPTLIAVGATAAGVQDLPSVLLLEEVSSAGQSLGVIAELRDDGEGVDGQARDGRYTAALELGSPAESERFFRVRTENPPRPVAPPAIFPVTDLRLGLPASDPEASVPTPDGVDRALTNQAVFTTRAGTSPRRAREIVGEVGAELGEPVEIVGYLPGIDGYMVRFSGASTYAAIIRVVQALERHAEIARATPTYVGRQAVDWWLQETNVIDLRAGLPTPSGSGGPPLLGSSDVGVAVVELFGGVGCGGLPCMPAGSIGAIGACSGLYGSPGVAHGTKVANLVAEPPSPMLDEGGVAPEIGRLLPLTASAGPDVVNALNCVQQYNTAAGADRIHVVNMSLETNLQTADDALLQGAICSLACGNVLTVAAAGNHACPAAAVPPFPGRYGTSTSICACNGEPLGNFVLSVGGTTMSSALGDTCAADNEKSHEGDIYAPGWGIPGSPGPNGTSWAAPQVAGCAAVRGSVSIWSGGPGAWDAKDVESRLRNKATPIAALSGGGLLDCEATVQEPFDIVFLLDRSGSMATGTPTRWDGLTTAVDTFTDLLANSAPPGSGFGLTLFSSSVVEPVTGLIGDANTIDAHLALTPSGTTGMGPGLKNAMAKLGAADRPRVVLLFTDGEQNVPLPTVNPGGCGYSDGTPISTACPGGEGSVKIVPVGVTSPSSPYLSTLHTLADMHGGTLLITDDGTTADPGATLATPCTGAIEDAFLCAVAPALYGASLQMVTSTQGPLLPGRDLATFSVNRDVARLLMTLRVTGRGTGDLRRVLARLRVTKDGDDVSAYFARVAGGAPGSALLVTDFRSPAAASVLPDLAPHGRYVVSLAADSQVDPQLPQQDVRIFVFADDHRLDMRWELGPPSPRAGQRLEPRVSLRWAGRPVTDAEVVARIFRPGADLGHVLALNPLRVDPVSGPDAPSPGWQKYDRLRRTDEAFLASMKPQENLVPLAHAGDGRYTGSFDPGDISGVYQIVYQVRAEDADFGAIERVAEQSAYLRFGEIDWEASILSRTVQGDTITLRVRPVTATGLFTGPGQAAMFAVAGAQARIVSIEDHQDGAYTLIFSADPESQIELSALGETVYEGRADFRARGRWWLWVLLVILAAA
jgi:hypothetical protein